MTRGRPATHNPRVRSLCLILLAPLFAASAVADPGQVAVLPVVGDEVAAETRELLEAALRAEVRRVGAFDVQPTVETRRQLEGVAALGLDCDAREPICAGELGALCGVRQVVVPLARPDESSLVLTLVLVDVSDARVLSHVDTRLDGGLNEMVPSVRGAVQGLFVAAPAPVEEPAPTTPLLWGVTAGLVGAGVAMAAGGAVAGIVSLPLMQAPLRPGDNVVERGSAIVGAQVLMGSLYGVGAVALLGGGATAAAALLLSE